MIKKPALHVLLLALAIVFSASCAKLPSGSDTKAESRVRDFEMNSATAGSERVFDTEDSVYYLVLPDHGSERVYVSDKVNKDWLPLCSKPNCTHADESCDSVVEGSAMSKMWLCGNSIYYIVLGSRAVDDSPALWRMRLDGSAHELLLRIPLPDDEAYSEHGWSWMFHNKYAILTFRGGYEGPGGEMISVGKYFIIDLGGDRLEVKPLEIRSDGESSSYLGTMIAGRGNFIYSVILPNGDNILYRTDLETGERIEVGVLPVVPELFDCTLEGDRLIMCDGWDSGAIYEFSLETGETKVLAQAAPRTQLWHRYYKGRVYGAHYGLEGSPFATGVFELDGSPIQILDGSTYEKHMMLSFMVGDLAFGYVSGEDYIRKPPEYYLDLTKVGTEEFRWRKWGD